MNHPKEKIILYLICILFLAATTTAEENLSIQSPENDTTCIIGPEVQLVYELKDFAYDECRISTNRTGTYKLQFIETTPNNNAFNSYNISLDPGSYGWSVTCTQTAPAVITTTPNASFIVTDAPYCATLTGTTCTASVNLKSEGFIKTRLGNTKGFWLSNQDCQVWIERTSDSKIMKRYRTMAYDMQTKEMTDNEGNDINVIEDKEFVVTDSLGYYIYPFTADPIWARVNEEYTIHTTCNGQQVECRFNVSRQLLPDQANYREVAKEGSGYIVGLLALIIAIVGFIIFLRMKWRQKKS